MSRPASPPPSVAVRAGAGGAHYVLNRTGGHKWLRKQMNKVFPDHWSFLLGEIALYSFIILLLTGVYLTLFFDSSP
ncbi:MAG: ubiquinol-cytochrome c reductase cytochrome b subunit, partial [Frankiaceae bacterium]|nr:ubiquinol-cytochrome c reductase cytochrome b subunit [Frankiaceae bacterium]